MNFIGLKLILADMAFIQVIVTEKEAITMIDNFINNKYDSSSILGGSNQFGSWAVKVEYVQAIHTVSLQEQSPTFVPGKSLNTGKYGMS